MDRLVAPGVVRRIGLTGGIGSGKSTVARTLADCGAHVVDTDDIAHALTTAGGVAMSAIVAAFGAAVRTPDGALDRAAMRGIVFADATARSRLEAILHPLIGEEAERRAAAAGDAPVVFDVPLLAELAYWRDRVDRVVVVDCSVDTQIARVGARPGWTADAAARVVGAQATRAARRAIADAVIDNDAISLAVLADETCALWRRWCARRSTAAQSADGPMKQ